MITRDFLVTGGFRDGYVPKLGSAVVQPVFAGANIAVRREVLAEIGGFDNACGTREDADLSLRVAQTRWLIFHDERAIVQHRFRSTFPEMLRQWWHYGHSHARVLRKHTRPGIEIFVGTGTARGMMSYRIPFPIRVFIPLNLFHLFHGALAVAVVAHLLNRPMVAAGFGLLALILGVRHFLLPFPKRQRRDWLLFLGLRYLTNWSFVMGGFVGGLREGMLNIEPAHDRNGLPDDSP